MKRRTLENPLTIATCVIGSVVSFLPGFEPPELDSHILLTVVLPPLLYSAAVQMPTMEFRRDFGAISALYPVSAVLLAWVILKEKLSTPLVVGIAIALSGCVLLGID